MLLASVGVEKTQKKIRLKEKPKVKARLTRFAIIDLGTNSVRLDVYKLEGQQLVRVYRGKSMVRLGDGVFRTGRISADVMQRTLDVFISMRLYLDQMGIKSVMAFGTSALRSAANARTFLATVQKRTGIRVRIISGLEEARLIAKGVVTNIPTPKGKYALIDIGGGSTEISICSGRRVLKSYSFPLGANRLTQMFYKGTKPKAKQLHPELALRHYVRVQLADLQKFVTKHKVEKAIGSSGTIRTVGRMLKKMGCKVNPASRVDITAFVGEIKFLNRQQVLALPGVESKRADLIIPGSILIEEILYCLNCKRLEVTEFALRDGLLYSVLERI